MRRIILDNLVQIQEAIWALQNRFDDRKLYRNTCHFSRDGAGYLYTTIPNDRFALGDGTALLPTYTFLAEQDTGMYRVGDNQIGFTAQGAQVAGIYNDVVGAQILLVDGDCLIPSYSFLNDRETGMYSAAANILGFAAGGILATIISGVGGGTITVDGLALTGGSITDASGVISFGDEIINIGNNLIQSAGYIDSKTTYAINGTTVFTIAGTANILLGDCGANYTGSYGVGIGAGSMGEGGAGCSGSYNFFVGYNCGRICTSGNQNIGLGAQCFNALNTGIYNASIGTNSSYSMTSARYNTAYGFQALYTVLTEWGNVGIGFNCARYYRGQYSVLIGYESGRGGTGATYTGADYNTCVGYNSGYALVTNQTGCVFYGNQAGRYETGSNTLMIDNQARTNEATHRLGALIYGLFNATATSQELRFNASVYIKEGPAGGNTDHAGYGQLYCKDNAGTTELWFVDDSGVETQLA